MGRRVCLVGSGQISLPFYWQSAPEVWAAKAVGFVLKQKGYQVNRNYWMDNVNELIQDWGDGTSEALTDAWPFGSETVLWLMDYPRWCGNMWAEKYPHIHIYPTVDLVTASGTDFICDTGAMMLAHAWFEQDIEEVHLHGFDYLPAKAEEKISYGDLKQKIAAAQCAGYWIGKLEGRGCKVHVNHVSPLLETRRIIEKSMRIRGFPVLEGDKLPTTHMERWNFLKKTGGLVPVRSTKIDFSTSHLCLSVNDIFKIGEQKND